jgi:uncharacterized membrane-anchored protein
MKSNKKPPLQALIICIIGILVFFTVMITINEYTLYTWEEIFLETAPVDPRDLLRGDYVILRYAFEESDIIDRYITQNNISIWTLLYISFQRDEKNVGTISSVSESNPKTGVFLKVKTQSQWWRRSSLETGIWKYFVPEWTGKEIERIRWDMTVQIKVDTYGSAKIIDLYYKWEKVNPKAFKANELNLVE